MKKVLARIMAVIGFFGLGGTALAATQPKRIVYVKKEPASKVRVIRVQRRVKIKRVKPTKKIVYVKKEPARKK